MAGCKNDFTEEATFNPNSQFTDYPTYLCKPNNLKGYESIGSSVMMNLLLTQYQDSDNLIEYMSAFVSEMDKLLEECKKVKLGRYIQNATGAQLDVIGIILQQSRNLNVPTVFFGFQGASPVGGMIDGGALDLVGAKEGWTYTEYCGEAAPPTEPEDDAIGGIFKDEGQGNFTVTPLSDVVYRNVLLCRAYCINQGVFSINVVYNAISALMGKVPNTMKFTEISHKVWELQLDSLTNTSYDINLILATKHWYIPMGVVLNISLVGGLFDVRHNDVLVTHNTEVVTHTA